MAQIEGRPTVTLRVTISLSEEEAGALDALVGYGVEPFLKVFYEKMGRHYLQPYEKGLRSLFESRGMLGNLIERAETARSVFTGEYVARPAQNPANVKSTAQPTSRDANEK